MIRACRGAHFWIASYPLLTVLVSSVILHILTIPLPRIGPYLTAMQSAAIHVVSAVDCSEGLYKTEICVLTLPRLCRQARSLGLNPSFSMRRFRRSFLVFAKSLRRRRVILTPHLRYPVIPRMPTLFGSSLRSDGANSSPVPDLLRDTGALRRKGPTAPDYVVSTYL